MLANARYPRYIRSPQSLGTARPPVAGGSDELTLQYYAPEIRYDSLETYRADAADTITNNYVRDGDESVRSNWLNDSSGNHLAASDPNLPEDDLWLGLIYSDYWFSYSTEPTPASSDDHIDEANDYVVDAQRMHGDSSYADTIYGRVVPLANGERILQYWFFYYYNPNTYFGFGAHEGDWEMAQVRVGADGHAIEATYAQHDNGERCAWEHVQRTDDGHPVVYPGEGSHTSYFSSGYHFNDGGNDNADGEGAARCRRSWTSATIRGGSTGPGTGAARIRARRGPRTRGTSSTTRPRGRVVLMAAPRIRCRSGGQGLNVCVAPRLLSPGLPSNGAAGERWSPTAPAPRPAELVRPSVAAAHERGRRRTSVSAAHHPQGRALTSRSIHATPRCGARSISALGCRQGDERRPEPSDRAQVPIAQGRDNCCSVSLHPDSPGRVPRGTHSRALVEPHCGHIVRHRRREHERSRGLPDRPRNRLHRARGARNLRGHGHTTGRSRAETRLTAQGGRLELAPRGRLSREWLDSGEGFNIAHTGPPLYLTIWGDPVKLKEAAVDINAVWE